VAALEAGSAAAWCGHLAGTRRKCTCLTAKGARQVRTDVARGGEAAKDGLLAKIAPRDITVDGEDEAGLASARARDWLGKVPGGSVTYSAETAAALEAAGFVALPVKAGDLVCFPGTTDHLSLRNETPKARHTFQLHLVEGPGAGVEWYACLLPCTFGFAALSLPSRSQGAQVKGQLDAIPSDTQVPFARPVSPRAWAVRPVMASSACLAACCAGTSCSFGEPTKRLFLAGKPVLGAMTV
jgi:hypothetical protein